MWLQMKSLAIPVLVNFLPAEYAVPSPKISQKAFCSMTDGSISQD